MLNDFSRLVHKRLEIPGTKRSISGGGRNLEHEAERSFRQYGTFQKAETKEHTKQLKAPPVHAGRFVFEFVLPDVKIIGAVPWSLCRPLFSRNGAFPGT